MPKIKGFLDENKDNKDKTLGEIIKYRRESINLSQREVARKVNIDNSGLAKIEKGERKKPSVLILKKLSMILAIDLEFLMKKAGYEQSEINVATNQTFMYIEGSCLLLNKVVEIEQKELDKLIKERDMFDKMAKGEIKLSITDKKNDGQIDVEKFIKNQLKEKNKLVKEQTEKVNGLIELLNKDVK
jgi:toxin-antitoxin system, antitoxin component, xre family